MCNIHAQEPIDFDNVRPSKKYLARSRYNNPSPHKVSLITLSKCDDIANANLSTLDQDHLLSERLEDHDVFQDV